MYFKTSRIALFYVILILFFLFNSFYLNVYLLFSWFYVNHLNNNDIKNVLSVIVVKTFLINKSFIYLVSSANQQVGLVGFQAGPCFPPCGAWAPGRPTLA
jgi:hypothetical protein